MKKLFFVFFVTFWGQSFGRTLDKTKEKNKNYGINIFTFSTLYFVYGAMTLSKMTLSIMTKEEENINCDSIMYVT